MGCDAPHRKRDVGDGLSMTAVRTSCLSRDCISRSMRISGFRWVSSRRSACRCPKWAPLRRHNWRRAGSIKRLQRLGGSGGMVLRRRACSSCFSSADLETEMHVSDHRQLGGECLPGLNSAHGSRLSFGPERVEAASDVRLDQDVRRRWPLRSAASSVGQSCEAG